jgi:hypothetical protein
MTTTTALKSHTSSVPSTRQSEGGFVRALVRLKAASLDRRLAAGEAAASDQLLAARANLLVEWQGRRCLAEDWEHLLSAARKPTVARSPRLPLQSEAIVGAEHYVRELVAKLRQPADVSPRGVALARLLMTDGAGPLYNPRRAADLVPALRSATTSLTRPPVDSVVSVAGGAVDGLAK